MTHGTIEETFEYHLVNIVKKVISVTSKEHFQKGEDLEIYLDHHHHDLAEALLDDIQVWMGFDDLLKEMKREEE